MAGWVVCPRRHDRKVSLEVCIGVCAESKDCGELKDVPEADIEAAKRKLNKLPATLERTVLTEEEGEELGIQDEPKGKGAEEAGALLNRALAIKNEIEGKFWEMGAILNSIFKNQYYVDYGYRDWKDFCNEVLEMKWRTATYLRDIYVKFTGLGIRPDECIGIGWGRLKELLPVVNKENVKYWLTEAKKKGASIANLNAKVRVALGKITQEESEKLPAKLTFSLYEKQEETVERALELARRITGSESRGYQLEMVCTEFRVTYEAVDEDYPKVKLGSDLIGRIESLLEVKFSGEVLDLKTGEILVREAK
jgi:hypothetical protein